MRILLFIVICFCVLSLKAQKRWLTKEQFKHQELSSSWIIVKFKPNAAIARGAKTLKPSTHKKKSILDGMAKIPVNKGEDPLALCNKYLKRPEVIYAEPIVIDHPLVGISDSLVSDQYYLANIKAVEAWEITKGDDDIAIAIIDTGLDLNHEDLINNLWLNLNDPIDGIDNDNNGYIDDYYGYDFADLDNLPEADPDDHGARVGGIAGATPNNEVGIAGIGYNTQIAALKGFSSITDRGQGLFDAILYAADNDIEILNLSWGSIREPLRSEQDIINYAVLEKNVVIVAAAGNEGAKATAEEKFYPASYDHVLSVGGSTIDDTKWSGSSYNHAVDLVAPANNILTTSADNGYLSSAGTSFASPMVAAAAALVIDEFPSLNAQQVMERIRVTSDDIYSIGTNSSYQDKLGRGRLNVLRAVSERNLKSMRAENINIQSTYDNIYFGDTVSISFDLTNYLEAVNDPGIYVSSIDGDFQPIKESFFPDRLTPMQDYPVSLELILSEDLEPETTVDVRLDFTDGNYQDVQFIDLKTAPNYIHFGNEHLKFSIAGNGSLGTVDPASNLGMGLVYQAETVLNHSGILLARSSESIANNIILNFNTLAKSDDFITRKYIKQKHHPFASHYGYSEFSDPINELVIEQSLLAPEPGEYIIIQYRIINTSEKQIDSLTFGLYTDWDLGLSNRNFAAIDHESNYAYARNEDSTLFGAGQIIAQGNAHLSALDLKSLNGNAADLDSIFSDEKKYNYLIDQNPAIAGEVGIGNDVATIQGVTLPEIDSAGFEIVSIILAMGNTQTAIEEQLTNARAFLDSVEQHPEILETVFTCDGGNTSIDPQGTLYAFYSDPLAQELLSIGEQFSPASIEKDTSFYVRNLDQRYPSDVFEIQVQLFEDIASFEIDQDTLYLDHPTTNIASFYDRSINAISWTWNFGEGTSSTLQNPMVSFNQPGSYLIQLQVENEFGCTDTFASTLVVANRPPSISFPDLELCPFEETTISDPSASTLYLFATETQTQPISEGSELSIGPFFSDTTVYVSARINGLLTKKSALRVNIQEVKADFQIYPDTLSSSFQLRIIADVDPTASINWILNGSSIGSDREVSIPAVTGVQRINLEVNAGNGCLVNIEKTFEVSSSPSPTIDDLIACKGSPAIIRPENGNYFGFYADSSLNLLLKKGTHITMTEDKKLYVVGLDDGLPGDPVEINVIYHDFETTIEFTASVINGINKVQLSAKTNAEILNYQWFIDGVLSETTPDPVFFLNDEVKEVILVAENRLGCLASDSITLDLSPPLGSHTQQTTRIFPNPTKGIIQIFSAQVLKEMIVYDLAGNMLSRSSSAESVNLSGLESGVYILELIDFETSKKF